MKRPQFLEKRKGQVQWQGQLLNGLDYVITKHGKQIFVDVFDSSIDDPGNAHVQSEIMDDIQSSLKYLRDMEQTVGALG